MKICIENLVLVKIEKKSGILHEDLTTFYCCQLYNFVVKYCCATLNTYVFLTVDCSSVLRRERAVDFSLHSGNENEPQFTLCVHCISCYSNT
jgi:hypothetical protein